MSAAAIAPQEPETQVCKGCHIAKPLNAFAMRSKTQRKTWCFVCLAKYQEKHGTPEAQEARRKKFNRDFRNSAQTKAMRALEVLDKIQTHGRAEIARVAAAKAIMDKVVANESQVTVSGQVTHAISYADTLRQLALKMHGPNNEIIIDNAEVEPLAQLPQPTKEPDGE